MKAQRSKATNSILRSLALGLISIFFLNLVVVIAEDKQVYYDITTYNHGNACQSDNTEDARQTFNAPETFRLTEFTYYVANVINPTTIRARVYRNSDNTFLGEDNETITGSYDFNFTFPEIQIDENLNYEAYSIRFSVLDGSGWGTYFQYGYSFYEGGEVYCCCGLGSKGGADYYGKMYGIPGPTPAPISQTGMLVTTGQEIGIFLDNIKNPLPILIMGLGLASSIVGLIMVISFVIKTAVNKIGK